MTSVDHHILSAWTLRYDEVGNLVRTREATGQEVFFEYDARGLLTRRHGDDPEVPVDDTYAYDGRGRQVLARNAQLTLTAEYDALDRPVAVHNELMGLARRVYDHRLGREDSEASLEESR